MVKGKRPNGRTGLMQTWAKRVLLVLATIPLLFLCLSVANAYATQEGANIQSDDEFGNIELKYTVQSDFDMDKNTAWHFVIELDDKTISGVYGDGSQGKPIEFNEGVARIDLSNAEIASTAKSDGQGGVAYTLPAGVGYTVTGEMPEGMTEGMTTTWNGNTSGAVTGQATASVEAVNTRGTGGFTLSLFMESGDPSDMDRIFMFPVVIGKLDGEYLSGTFGDITFDGLGTSIVMLKNGQSVTTAGLPEGLMFTASDIYTENFDYEIYADPVLDATLNKNNATAYIIKDATPKISFTNLSKSYGPLTVGKKVVSDIETDQDREFKFTVTLTNSDGSAAPVNGELDTVDVASDGTKTPAGKVSFSNGIANVAVKGGYEKIIKNLPSSKEYQYKVEEVEANNNAWATTAENASGAITHEGTKASFVNERKTGALDVTKTIVGVSGKQFAFTVTLYEDEAAARAGNPLSLTKDCGDMQFKDGVASFQLAHGQTSHGTNIPSDVYYVVEEVAEDDWSCTKSGDAGKIVADGLSTAKFVNEFVPKDAKGIGEVRVLKELEGRAWSDDDEFTFELAADSAKDQDGTQIAANEMPMPEGNTTISIDSGSDKDKAGNHYDSFGIIEFTKPGVYTYLVAESSEDDDDMWFDESRTVVFNVTDEEDGLSVSAYAKDYYGQPGEETSGAAVTTTAHFTNRYLYGPGHLVVRKVVKNGTDEQKARKYGFKVTIKDDEGNPDESVFGGYGATVTNANGKKEKGVVTFYKGKAEFELADGQSVEIASLPRGAAYEVVETDAGGLAASWTGNTGTIPKNGSAEAVCTNSRTSNSSSTTTKRATGSTAVPRTGDASAVVAPAAATAAVLLGAGYALKRRSE